MNIPHTHLANEKSDQNWMVVKGEKIIFPGGGTHFHYGADKYIASIANVRTSFLFLKYCRNVKKGNLVIYEMLNFVILVIMLADAELFKQ